MIAPAVRPRAIPTDWTVEEWDILIAALTRRKLLGDGLALGALAVLAACGASPTTPTSPAGAGWPRTVEHLLGSTTIPGQPTKVATAVDREDLDNVLALGLKPILFGYTDAYGTGIAPWQSALGAKDVPQYKYGEGVDVEAIARAKPDLIVGTKGFMEKVYPQLSAIAPTVATQINQQGWREGLRIVAKALGLETKGEQVIAETEKALVAGKERLKPVAVRKLMMGSPFGENMVIYGPKWPTFTLLGEMGIAASGGGATGFSESVSFERLQLLEPAEVLIIENYGDDLVAKLEALPTFRVLPAVRSGNYLVLDKETTRAVYLQSALNIPWATPRLIDTLLAAADGKGKKLA